jgi:uncharacterized protein YqhQ
MAQAIGGQAVLEGVMMRGPGNWAVAVRKPDGEIAEVSCPISSPMARHRIFRIPVIRGVVALGESLAIGFRALSVSANYAAAVDNPDEAEEAHEAAEIGRWTIVGSFVIAIELRPVSRVREVGPGLLVGTMPVNGTWFVVVEAAIRMTIVVGYLALLSLIPSLRRVFEYHAAEHKAINAYEAGEELTPETAQRYSLIHPRCGTSFLFWVVVLSAFVYAPFGRLPIQWLVVSRIVALPFIAGVAYELIRFAGKHADSRVVMTLLAPGMWLQRLTTREPSLDQLEVSIRALREVLDHEGRLSPAERRVEVMA